MWILIFWVHRTGFLNQLATLGVLGLLGGSCEVISGVISPLKRVVSLFTLLVTPVMTTLNRHPYQKAL